MDFRQLAIRLSVLTDGLILAVLSWCLVLGWQNLSPMIGFVGCALGLGLIVFALRPPSTRDWPKSVSAFGIVLLVLAAAIYLVPIRIVNAGSGQDAVQVSSLIAGLVLGAAGILTLVVGTVLSLSWVATDDSGLPPS